MKFEEVLPYLRSGWYAARRKWAAIPKWYQAIRLEVVNGDPRDGGCIQICRLAAMGHQSSYNRFLSLGLPACDILADDWMLATPLFPESSNDVEDPLPDRVSESEAESYMKGEIGDVE